MIRSPNVRVDTVAPAVELAEEKECRLEAGQIFPSNFMVEAVYLPF